jgi:hypothetical protein
MSGVDADRGAERYTIRRRGGQRYCVRCEPGTDPDPNLYTLWLPAAAVRQRGWMHCAGCSRPLMAPEPTPPT